MGRLLQVALGLLFWSPLFFFALWCHARPQISVFRLWLRFISYYLFAGFFILVTPFFFSLHNQAMGRGIGIAVGVSLWAWLPVSWYLARRRYRKMAAALEAAATALQAGKGDTASIH